MAERIACPNGCGRMKPAFAIRNGKCDACEAEEARASAGPIETTWNDIRGQRAIRLQQSDWTQVPDAPLDQTQRDAWASYRQALRDIPETYQTPQEVVWPTPPA